MEIYALSIHADYRCRRTSVCCSVGWDVPVELPVYRSLREAVDRGRLRADGASGPDPFVVGDDLPEGAAAMLGRGGDDRCVFLHRQSRLCLVHRDLGEPALPETCRHFPRLAVRDRRGTFISLSSFCPTAASMLFRDDRPLEVVRQPEAFPPAVYEGLTVGEDDLPPLLRPSMVMDLDGYTAWERHMVGRCADVSRRPESVLATLRQDACRLRRWTPGGRSLVEAVADLPAGYVRARPHASLTASLGVHALAMEAVPDDLRPELDEEGLDAAYTARVAPAWGMHRAPLNRYIAAKAFASWTAYQGRGVATIVRGLEAAVALVRVEAARQCRDAGRRLDADLLREAIRSADFTLNHLAGGDALAEGWGSAERPRSTSSDVPIPR